MKEFSLVSIVTPVYNGAEYLEELIQSVLQQDYPNIEHLIVDDGSQDGGATIAILKRHPHLRWWSRENKGQYATMNEGLLFAKGEIICFVSADDIVSSGAVTSAMEFLTDHPNFDGVFGTTNYINGDGKIQPYLVPFRKASISFYPYFAHISHCSLYIRLSSLQKHELLFDPSLRYVGDYDWIIRIHESRLRIGRLDRELSRVRIHDDQASQKYQDASRVETHRVVRNHRINIVLRSLLLLVYKIQVWVWKIFVR